MSHGTSFSVTCWKFLTNIFNRSILGNYENELFVIDWEFAHFGHRSCDLGQILGDLYEQKVYRSLDSAVTVLKGVFDGYGESSEEMAFRTAIYVGAHLMSWYNRQPRSSSGTRTASVETIIAGLTAGRDFMLRGWEKDRAFFQSSVLVSLFIVR